MKKNSEKSGRFSTAFKIGAVELSFLVIGYQAALFIHNVGAKESASPVTAAAPASGGNEDGDSIPAGQASGTAGGQERRSREGRKVAQSFRFNPNTAGMKDLQRLGFSEKQAQSIINYRNKGGRFYRASDFAKSYVVADSVFHRLEPYIDIPAIDINTADSAAFDNLPGIGPYYAAKMVEYREELGGYSYPEQLMEIRNFDQERFDGLKDLITLGPHPAFGLWTLDEDELASHPYLDKHAAHAIVLFRENSPTEECTVEALERAGILDGEAARKLSRCLIQPPFSE